jgi:dCMP deaminase
MRPSKDEYFMSMALLASTRATCPRRSVGAVLVNARGHVLATGYNGVAAGCDHCIDNNCPGACYPSGQGLEYCEAIHAEQNALLQCKDVWTIDTAYVTASPCVTCTKLFMNTSCRRIVFLNEYPQPDAKALWTKKGGEWCKYNETSILIVSLATPDALNAALEVAKISS